nr:uncharacterized protein CI109_003036 [Kwoniella shandongensis]KAA5528504.1 hypothetical protein CI109_003036 [Kwoniella shandongensis]
MPFPLTRSSSNRKSTDQRRLSFNLQFGPRDDHPTLGIEPLHVGCFALPRVVGRARAERGNALREEWKGLTTGDYAGIKEGEMGRLEVKYINELIGEKASRMNEYCCKVHYLKGALAVDIWIEERLTIFIDEIIFWLERGVLLRQACKHISQMLTELLESFHTLFNDRGNKIKTDTLIVQVRRIRGMFEPERIFEDEY